MQIVKSTSKPAANDQLILLINGDTFKKSEYLSADENRAVKEAIAYKRQDIVFNNGLVHKMICIITGAADWNTAEKMRQAGAKWCHILNQYKKEAVCVIAFDTYLAMAMCEGIALANYQFIKYKSDNRKSANALRTISVADRLLNEKNIQYINTVIESTWIARDLVNEPQNFLNAVQLSDEFKRIGKDAGFKVEVWNETKIESQKMGGILAVNKGSKIPPTFSIMEYKPKNAINKKPYVLVGKGVVYDTGGLSLKPTPMSMDHMKCDMAGSAVVVAVMNAVAKLNLPLYVVGLVPATDNWIGENSYAPGDVITMYSGTTVEILNTDAEGRLVLADALHFAKKLKPELVCDFATLTGAAVRAIGPYATAVMGTADEEVKQSFFESSYAVFERLVEFPLWQDYADELKSELADMTNLGKSEGGHISAGKFLQHFTDYPWMHFDIAGPAFNHAHDAYKPKGGTGVGVRLMIDFFQKLSSKTKK
jgi:leucyl aminopeptidase